MTDSYEEGWYSDNWGIGTVEKKVPIIDSQIEEYTDYERSLESSIKSEVVYASDVIVGIGNEALNTAYAIDDLRESAIDEVKKAYNFAEWIPVVLLGAVVYKIVKW